MQANISVTLVFGALYVFIAVERLHVNPWAEVMLSEKHFTDHQMINDILAAFSKLLKVSVLKTHVANIQQQCNIDFKIMTYRQRYMIWDKVRGKH